MHKKRIKYHRNNLGYVNLTTVPTTGEFMAQAEGRLIGELRGSGVSATLNGVVLISNAIIGVPVCLDMYVLDKLVITGTNTGVLKFAPIL